MEKKRISLCPDVDVNDESLANDKLIRENLSKSNHLTGVISPFIMSNFNFNDQYYTYNSYNNIDNLHSFLPNSIDSICPLTFWRSYYITNVKLPENLKTIPGRMFEDCTSLVNIVIPNSVIKIGPGAFGGCSNLKTINLGNNITTIGQGGGWSGTIYGAFYGCSSLESIVIPSKVEIIPPRTFDGCKSLTFVEIPNGLKEIGNESFNGTKITSISLPKTITKIGESAFSGATSLSTIIVYNDSPISITDNVFSYNTYLTGNLYVPEGSSGLYKSSESGWCNFASILEGEPELNMTNIKMSFNEGGSKWV